MTELLKFSRGNAKLDELEKVIGGEVWTFSLLSGHTCPFAKDCLSKAVDVNGKRHIEDGPNTLFRCFSASQEVLFPNVYDSRKYNYDLVKAQGNVLTRLSDLIIDSLPKQAKAIRVHVGGDFFTLNYMTAWMDAACMNKGIRFYAYTKSLNMWIQLKKRGAIPDNFVFTASRGGMTDYLIDEHNLREARVVFSEQEATNLGLEIDHDDSHALNNGPSFALLIHGTQPKGTEAAKAIRKLKGMGSYGRGTK